MKRTFLLLCFISNSFLLFSQKGKIKVAENYFSSFQYLAASQTFEEILRNDSSNLPVKIRLAECYQKLNDSEREEYYLSKICKSPGIDPKYFKTYSMSLAKNGKYEQAVVWLQKYSTSFPNEDVKSHIDSYKNLNEFYKHSSFYKVKEVNYNSDNSDFSPAFYRSGIVFCSSRKIGNEYKWDNTPFIDLYFKNDSLPYPVPLSNTLNSELHEGPVSFSQNADTIYFTRNINASKGNEGVLKLGIFYSVKSNGKWGKPKQLELKANASIGHPALSPDNKLYFVSDIPGGFGGTDLYYTKKVNGKWTAPVNLGAEINTNGNEVFPFIDQKGNLYYASNGYPGLGGLDVFEACLKNKTFAKPTNMGHPINSSKDDFGYIVKGKNAFFSSNRGANYKDDNLYSVLIDRSKFINIMAIDKSRTPITNFLIEITSTYDSSNIIGPSKAGTTYTPKLNIEEEDYKITIFKEGFYDKTHMLSRVDLLSRSYTDTLKIVLEAITREKTIFIDLVSSSKESLLGGTVELVNSNNGKTDIEVVKQTSSVSLKLEKGNYYEIIGSKKDYKTNTLFITQSTLDTLRDGSRIELVLSPKNALFEKNEMGQTIEMDIQYDRNKFEIRPDAARELNRLINYLKKYPNLMIELGSHTDDRGSEESNFILSQKRAESAVNYMVSRGIESSRLIPLGYGETEPKIAEAHTEEEHQQNRRTTVKIVGK